MNFILLLGRETLSIKSVISRLPTTQLLSRLEAMELTMKSSMDCFAGQIRKGCRSHLFLAEHATLLASKWTLPISKRHLIALWKAMLLKPTFANYWWTMKTKNQSIKQNKKILMGWILLSISDILILTLFLPWWQIAAGMPLGWKSTLASIRLQSKQLLNFSENDKKSLIWTSTKVKLLSMIWMRSLWWCLMASSEGQRSPATP